VNTSTALTAEVGYLREQARDFKITTRKDIKKAIKLKYGTLSSAAEEMGVVFQMLSDTLHGRRHIFQIIDILQDEFGLSNEQVVEFWPLVKEWPKKSRIN